MKITLQNVGRSYKKQTIFRGINHTFEVGSRTCILGGNGSGKSTLIKILSHALSPSQGELHYYKPNNNLLETSEVPFRISFAAPYFELIEELTAIEFLAFHQKFKPSLESLSPQEILEIAYLESSKNKEIENFSSGMKQRLKLSLALFSNVDLILLDEPTSNLDPEGIQWYNDLIKNYLGNRTIIVGSNFDKNEIGFCQTQLELKHFK